MSRANVYPPINYLKPVARNLWIIDGPAIRFGPWPFRMSFPTRATLIRTEAGLFAHSPTALTPALRVELDRIGPPRWIVGPNPIHYWWIPDWHEAWPHAEVWLAPGIEKRAKGRIDFPAHPLSGAAGYPWDDAIATLPVPGRVMNEVVFFHRASRTLILTDFVENFEASKLGGVARFLARIGQALDPHGSMPRDMRLAYKREDLRNAVTQMIAWDPERIILAHGRWYERNGTAELKRAFRWLLD
jgi:hypothetical protein